MTISTTTDSPHGIDIIGYVRKPSRGVPQKVHELVSSMGGRFGEGWKPEKCDLAVIWGHYNPQVEAYHREHGIPFLLMEYGYYGDKDEFTGFAYNGMHGCGLLPPPGEEPRPQPELKPWRTDKGVVLLCGQIPSHEDPLCREGLTDLEWYDIAIPEIRQKYPGRKIRFRQHPRVGCYIPEEVDEHHDAAVVPLHAAIQGVEVAYSYNSTVDVKLTCLGVPCVSQSRGSMVGNHPEPWDRTEWAHWISYCHWSREELKDGTAARHILKGYPAAKEAAQKGFGCDSCLIL